jgi:outer membrane lipoprotein-sorting protein
VQGESPAPPVTIVNTLPFSTKEPSLYQADLVISFPSADTVADTVSEQKYFIARDGETRRTDYQLSEKDTMVLLEKPDGKAIILLPQKKCSTEEAAGAGNPVTSQNQSLKESLTTGWLAEKIPANFTDLGKEDMGGKMLSKYRVRFEKTGGVESRGEALVWVDAELGMPVKTEIYSLKNDQPANKVITEFRNLKLSVDPGVFNLPAGCQNISAKEMQNIMRQMKLDSR